MDPRIEQVLKLPTKQKFALLAIVLLLAWLAWVVVHIFQLVGFRNRLQVMVDWIWNYFAYDRPVRRMSRVSRRGENPLAGD